MPTRECVVLEPSGEAVCVYVPPLLLILLVLMLAARNGREEKGNQGKNPSLERGKTHKIKLRRRAANANSPRATFRRAMSMVIYSQRGSSSGDGKTLCFDTDDAVDYISAYLVLYTPAITNYICVC